jgi:polar amino acid transport system permease protein
MLGSLNTRVMLEYLPEIWQGFLSTLMLSTTGFAGALALGIVACALSIQPLRWLRLPATVYIDAVRATPLLAQLYFLYFGLPRLGVLLPEMLIGIIVLSLNSGAYVAEIIRSGILADAADHLAPSATPNDIAAHRAGDRIGQGQLAPVADFRGRADARRPDDRH